MSLEQALAENTKALLALTAALANGASVGSTSASSDTEEKTTTKPAAKTTGKGTTTKATKPKAETVDPDTLKAKLIEFKNLTDLPTAQALTKKLGYAAIGDVPAEESKAVFDAISQAIVDLDNDNTADDANEDEAL